MAIKTIFRWIVVNRIEEFISSSTSSISNSFLVTAYKPIEIFVKHFWELKEFMSSAPQFPLEEH